MEDLPRTATEAKALGLKRYYTGVPCPKGHYAPRSTANTSCTVCLKDYPKAAEARRIYKRKKRLALRGGCTPEMKAQMIAEQGGRCAICESQDKILFVDHCHDSNKIRAALCMSCNTALGHAADNPKILRKMADYLESHKGE